MSNQRRSLVDHNAARLLKMMANNGKDTTLRRDSSSTPSSAPLN